MRNTGLIVAGVGVIVSIVGWLMEGRFWDGVLGFGLAHIFLGLLDTMRTPVKA
ncbi:MAG: hypothetical protein NUW23_09880 [Firmicutes bacterium]|jgi:hypothetical protein|nr:hypothetical protein [Bacillota bacterium]